MKSGSDKSGKSAAAGAAAAAAAGASELMKKVLTVGVGTLFLNEDSLRSLVSEFKLPKELLGGVLESANKTKNEFLQGLSQDIINRVSEKVDPVAFLEEFLSRNEIELNMKISVKPKKKHHD